MTTIDQCVEEAAHLLPEQAPLHAFVHHNTLHAFEHLPFKEGVIEASKRLGTETFQSEAAFDQCLRSGRIRGEDLDAILDTAEGEQDLPLFAGGPTRREFRRVRLGTLFEIPKGAALMWLLSEGAVRRHLYPGLTPDRRAQLLREAGPMREAAALAKLWDRLLDAAPETTLAPPLGIRKRDEILATTAIDTDEAVHPRLIRVTAAYLDQGVAYWPMPERREGLLAAFRKLYAITVTPPNLAFRGLAETLSIQEQERWDATKTIEWALEEFAIPTSQWGPYITETLLSLRGWAGMVRQFEVRPDRAPVEAFPALLLDYLAVQLILDLSAARNVLAAHEGSPISFADLEGLCVSPNRHLPQWRCVPPESERYPRLELTYEAFILAQILPVPLELFADRTIARALVAEVQALGELERRWLLHLAYERRHAVEVLDGIEAHCRLSSFEFPQPEFQAIFCIDDREESLRRHLEECCPEAETLGYAGFYGVAMQYQGLEDIRPRPLCPVPITPKHLIVERAIDPQAEQRFRVAARRQAVATLGVSVASKTLVRGSLVSSILGAAAMIPLLGYSLFPRLAARLGGRLSHGIADRPATRLQLERSTDEKVQGLWPGYRVAEMIEIVHAALVAMGMTRKFSPLVIVVGHGSSSLNNPHEAAHDCGATGGGRGGPNARAFSAMANRPEVRVALGERGIAIPSSTYFVGACHNTCDDRMTYYDDDLVPEPRHGGLVRAKASLAEACRRDAHERCRRFESAPADLPLAHALFHADAHANDLAQPRPEYGHATNAVCIVGRRSRTRGLFLDRRAFLVSYDPSQDLEGETLAALLLSVGPVGAGISLEYYFSFIDPDRYGSGTKLPHNITGLIGVMDGHASDLRTGLPWQMVEIHEPVRLLVIVEVEPELLMAILEREPGLWALVDNGWIRLVAWSPSQDLMHVFENGGFRPHVGENEDIPVVARSVEHYGGKRDHLGPAHISPAATGAAR